MMPVSFYEIKREVLIALYTQLHTSDGPVFWYPRQTLPLVDTNASLSMISKALLSLEGEELVESQIDPEDPDHLPMFTLSDLGISRAEQLTGNVDPTFGIKTNLQDGSGVELVDHGHPAAQEITEALEDLEQKIKVSNEAFSESEYDREASIAEIRALRALWQAGVVRIQIFKERALSSLRWVAEKGASVALTEACKHVIKLILGW